MPDEPASAVTGLDDALAVTPPRPPHSIRRTSHIDMAPAADGSLGLRGAARDLRTAEAGAEEVGRAAIDVDVDVSRVVTRLQTSGDPKLTDPLLGLGALRGFRAAIDAAVPDERERSTPLYLLLDEIPMAGFISGYAYLYSGALGEVSEGVGVRADICSGWRSDGSMMVAIRRDKRIPIPYGPPANDLVPDDDPLAWHELPPLAAGTMRRQRLVEVAAAVGAPMPVYAMFRDTHADPDGRVTILHEYAVTSTLDPRSLVLANTTAQPHVLPWPECPEAAASASRLDGHAAGHVRDLVRADFSGTSTCTHLNDLLRSLADVVALSGALWG